MEYEPFSHVLLEQRRGSRAFLASSSTHVNLVLVLVFWRFISPAPDLNFRPKVYETRIIRYEVPEPLLFAGAGRAGGAGGGQGGRAGASGGQSGGGGQLRPPKLTIEIPRMPGLSLPGPAAPKAPEAAAQAPAPGPPKPTFELPQSKPTPHRDLIIQPEFSPDTAIAGRPQLPNLFLWSQREIKPLERQLRTFTPGEPVRQQQPRPQALPDAPPKLELPNQEVQVTDLKVAEVTTKVEKPKLPVFAATTSPVRLPRRNLDAPSEIPGMALPPKGEPVNLLAIMDRLAPPSSSYAVEAGNRFPSPEPGGGGGENGTGMAAGGAGNAAAGAGSGTGSQPGAAGAGAGGAGAAGGGARAGTGAGAGTGGGTGSGAGAGTGPGTGAGTGAGSGSGSGRGAGSGTGGSGSGSGAGASGPGTGAGRPGLGAGGGSGNGAGAGGSGAGLGAGSGTGAGGRGSGSGSRPGGQGSAVDIGGLSIAGGGIAIRTESPNTSTFDVVVVNPNAGEMLPESAGVLSGQPVYTVYLTVPGSPREWILQFAVPHAREPVEQRTTTSVRIGAAAPVRPPFPLRKPNLQLGPEAAGATGRVVIFGNINVKGTLEELRVIRSVRSEIDQAVITCLKQFQFRPAVRDGAPVLVEALFGIPLN